MPSDLTIQVVVFYTVFAVCLMLSHLTIQLVCCFTVFTVFYQTLQSCLFFCLYSIQSVLSDLTIQLADDHFILFNKSSKPGLGGLQNALSKELYIVVSTTTATWTN